MKKTYNPIIWLKYLAWCIQFWASGHAMAYPGWLRKWLLFTVFPDKRRHGTTWRMIHWWRSQNDSFFPLYYPLPWWVGPHALGPFYNLPFKLTHPLRRFAGASHRCEFTDKGHGALYTGTVDPFMDRLFEQFIKNIDEEESTWSTT
jgi:hypothetical protein